MRLAALPALLLITLLSACASQPSARTPMPVLRYAVAGPHRPQTLLVLLPGRKDRADVFDQEGFIDLVRRHGAAADVIAADAHAGYYTSGKLIAQLDRTIIEPAHKRGYHHIILIGVSLGGYGAIRYAMAHPGKVSTLVLLSPFLGTGPFMRELAEAGDEDFAQTWSWLKGYPRDANERQRAAAGYPRLLLGYGEEDLFLHTDKELRALLPEGDTMTVPGAHLWGTWRALLDKLMDKLQAPALGG